MGLIRWFKRERIRRRTLKEIRYARENAPMTRDGQVLLARQIEKLRTQMNKEIEETCPRKPAFRQERRFFDW